MLRGCSERNYRGNFVMTCGYSMRPSRAGSATTGGRPVITYTYVFVCRCNVEGLVDARMLRRRMTRAVEQLAAPLLRDLTALFIHDGNRMCDNPLAEAFAAHLGLSENVAFYQLAVAVTFGPDVLSHMDSACHLCSRV
eukprot:COSAG01_NODE_8932_length_2609_cov_10.627092_2_plen_138_part_00